MRREHRPYSVRRAWSRFTQAYTHHFLRPHFDAFGEGTSASRPWYVHVAGPRIELGRYVNIVAEPDQRVTLAVWAKDKGEGGIRIGDYTIINPGVRITSASSITIGPNCMIAARALITDSDWHGVYDRIYQLTDSLPIELDENVWVGDSAIVCKGVKIGRNSIIGAGSVVVKDVPANVIAAGNPARVVRTLDPDGPFTTRSQLLANPEELFAALDDMERRFLRGNTILGWLRYLLRPRPTD